MQKLAFSVHRSASVWPFSGTKMCIRRALCISSLRKAKLVQFGCIITTIIIDLTKIKASSTALHVGSVLIYYIARLL